MEFRTYVVLTLLVATCDGQIADLFFPDATKWFREVTSGIVQHPLVANTVRRSEEVITQGVNVFSSVPIEIVRNLGFEYSLPLPQLHTSVSSVLADTLLANYKIGLGNEDITLRIDQLIPKYGYQLEQHDVVTDDGYILSMFRIPNNGSTVFLMHGLLGSADDFIIAGCESGLAYLLADEGYDVWLGNARGNKHSRRHVDMDPTNALFWDFSWHEIGYYDLPSMIDYILTITHSKTLKYIGHSQGTTAFFVMASERPEYNDKISLMIALSPVAFMSHVKSPFVKLFSPSGTFIHQVTKLMGTYEFLPDNGVLDVMKKLVCGFGPLSEVVCGNFLFLIVGFGYEQFNMTNLPVMLGHMPSGASMKQLAHYGQGIVSGDFKQFDLGIKGNWIQYGSEVPPVYALEKISAPVSLFYSDADWLADPINVDQLYDRLGNCIDIHRIPFEPFNHLDFLFANDFKTLIYARLQKLLTYF